MIPCMSGLVELEIQRLGASLLLPLFPAYDYGCMRQVFLSPAAAKGRGHASVHASVRHVFT